MAHRTGKTFLKGHGWVKKTDEAAANYDDIGEGWIWLIALFRYFPDFLMDICRDEANAEYDLSFIQRIFFRILARYQYVDITGCRGATKSFCVNGQKRCEALLFPGQISAIVGPSFKQSAKIASQINKQLENNYPLLTEHFTVEADSVDRFVTTTQFNSKISIEAFRGNTIMDATAEETAQEENPAFDADEFKEVVVPAIRGEYKVQGRRSKAYVYFKQHSITSAGRRQSYSYEQRHRHRWMMARGESAYVLDVPYSVLLLEQMRPVAWAENIRNELTGAAWLREMESVYSGSDKNPLIRDEIIDESRQLAMMEQHHCCKDRDNKLKAEDVIYIVGYDVSYRDAKGNAKCACVVLKCTKQNDFYHRDKYLKQVVWIEDWTPAETPTPIAQAQRIRRIWDRYTFEGSQTYLAIDAWQYGDGVLAALMGEPVGGARPLCCYRHLEKTELELEGAIPVIYPIRAGGTGVRDPDSEMINNCQMQFEHGNVQLLTQSMNEGVEQYKKYHRIKDDSLNYKISGPYKKTNELVQQMQNLREEPSGQGIREKRISQHIQRDSWSALKYAMRLAQILERSNLQKKQNKSDWDALLQKYKGGAAVGIAATAHSRMVVARQGGRRF